MNMQPQFPVKIMYSTAVVIVGLFIMAFLWAAMYMAINPLATSIATTMEQYENMTTYPRFTLVNTFMSNLWLLLMVIVALGLLYWAYIYAQRKNEGVYR